MLDQTANAIDEDLTILLVTAGHGLAALPTTGGSAIRCGLDALTAEALAEVSPGVVVAALTGAGFDALDVAERLEALEYHGRLRIMATALPDPALVQAEIAAAAPRLEIQMSCAAG